ncbi:MAG: hypothetical protein HY646_02130 [Acidobacteria bacterium]|nr:hypothetical protein [Acidobacteriota bacterium]
MLRQETVYGFVKDGVTGKKVASLPNGQTVELRSQDGISWFMRPDTLLAVRRRRQQETFVLTDREKAWLDLVELPWGGLDVRRLARAGYSID